METIGMNFVYLGLFTIAIGLVKLFTPFIDNILNFKKCKGMDMIVQGAVCAFTGVIILVLNYIYLNP